ncbi:MAG: hypothetical protein JWM89_3669 [Acidimicrobiales bacterium]|nr:hypothetical protein [Acidimicrobiales bacterium]
MQDVRRSLQELARLQRGLLTRADLRALGVTRDQRIGLQEEGTLRPVGARTFELGGLPPDARRTLHAACLDTGAVASHRTAAALHQLPGFTVGDVPEMLIGRTGVPTRRREVHLHTTTWLPADDLVVVDGIPCTTVARTLLSLAALVPEIAYDKAKGAVDDAVRMGLARDKWLWWRLEKLRCRGRNGVAVFEEILAQRANGEITESWLERQFLLVLDQHQMARPPCQRRVGAKGAFVARVDFLYAELGIVVEVTGAVGHSTPSQRAADAKRRNRLATLGYLVLEFTYERVVGDPEAMIAELVEAIAARSAMRLGAAARPTA